MTASAKKLKINNPLPHFIIRLQSHTRISAGRLVWLRPFCGETRLPAASARFDPQSLFIYNTSFKLAPIFAGQIAMDLRRRGCSMFAKPLFCKHDHTAHFLAGKKSALDINEHNMAQCYASVTLIEQYSTDYKSDFFYVKLLLRPRHTAKFFFFPRRQTFFSPHGQTRTLLRGFIIFLFFFKYKAS